MGGITKTRRGKRVRDPKTETGLAIEKDLLKKKEKGKRSCLGAGVGPVYKKRPCMAAIVKDSASAWMWITTLHYITLKITIRNTK